jgi:hypothetical protein
MNFAIPRKSNQIKNGIETKATKKKTSHGINPKDF